MYVFLISWVEAKQLTINVLIANMPKTTIAAKATALLANLVTLAMAQVVDSLVNHNYRKTKHNTRFTCRFFSKS